MSVWCMRRRDALNHREISVAEWLGWAIIKGDELVAVKQDHKWPEVSEFYVRQEYEIYASRGDDVRLARVKIVEQPSSDQL